MSQGTGPAELGLRALAETTHISGASHGAGSMGRVNGHGPQLSASSQGPSRAEGGRWGYGRQVRRGSGAGSQQILTVSGALAQTLATFATSQNPSP